MLRLGVVGYGHRITCLLTGPFTQAGIPYQVVGAVDPAEDFIRKRLADWGCADQKDIPFYPDLKTLVRKGKLDGLLIGTGCDLHTPFAIQAAAYDIPLFLEKPVSTSMEQALALEKAFRRAKCEVVVSFPLRVSPLCVKTKDILDNGAVGGREHITGLNYVPYGSCYFEGGPDYYRMSQGLLLQKATHDLDYMTFLMDEPIVRVGAMATFGHVFGGSKPAGLTCAACDEADTCPETPANRRRSGASGSKVKDHRCVFSIDNGTPESGMCEDSSSCLVEFASGAHGIYTQVFYTRRDARRRGAIVSGYKGTVAFDWFRNDIQVTNHHQPFSSTVTAGAGDSHFGGDAELAMDFLGLASGRIKRSRAPIETGLASVFACLAAKESVHTGKFVKVRQVSL